MSQTNIAVRANFNEEMDAKKILKDLQASAKQNQHELSKTINSLSPIDSHSEEHCIYIESMYRKGLSVFIKAYSGRIDPPVWFVGALHKLGSIKTEIREQSDDAGQIYYFIGRERASKKCYETTESSTNVPLTANSGNFPQGRVTVNAKLVSCEWINGNFDHYCLMHMLTDDGKSFIYKGSSPALTDICLDEYEKHCQLTAAFEVEQYNGKTKIFAKRPSKIKLYRIENSTITPETFTGDNQAFIKEPFGNLIIKYLKELNGDPNLLVQSINSSSVMGFNFQVLIELLKNINTYAFSGFAHYAGLHTGKKNMLELYSVGENFLIDLEHARTHLESLDVIPLKKESRANHFSQSWAVGDIDISIKLLTSGFELRLTSLPDLKLSPAKTYRYYLDNHGLAGAYHWHKLFEAAKQDAETGNAESMSTLGHMCNTSADAWSNQTQAEYWWLKAAELGNTSAMWALGMAYTSWKSWPDNMEKGLYYLKLGAELGCYNCKSEMERLLAKS